MTCGIERIAAYIPQYVLPLSELARARGVPPMKMLHGLGVQEMAITPPWEDVVCLAATAGERLLRAAAMDRDAIGMLVVATESGVDHAKPVAAFVHDLLGIGSRCRVYELKHACYSGTAGLMAAADWVRASGQVARRALVIAADIARYEVGSAAEPTQGAGAVAMLVGPGADLLKLDGETGSFAKNVRDFWRPLGRREAVVDGRYSLECYLNALAGAFTAYRALEIPALGWNETFLDRVARVLYHTPFPKMAMKAHRRLLELDLQAAPERWEVAEPQLEAIADASWRELGEPGVQAVARIGNTYTASLYLCLAHLLETQAEKLANQRLALFSYGSGCCAEFFTGDVPSGAARVANAGLESQLCRRIPIDVGQYEQLLHSPELGGEPDQGFSGDFCFLGIRNEHREYARSVHRATSDTAADLPSEPFSKQVSAG